MLACAACGYDASPDGDRFCNQCGAALRDIRPEPRPGHDEAMTDRGFAAVSDIGVLHAHRGNEDAVAIQVLDAPGGPWRLMALADGVSSSYRAADASRAAVDAALASLAAELGRGEPPPEALATAAVAAREAVKALPFPSGQVPPSSTLVLAVLGAARVLDYAHLGDSRLYWLPANGEPVQLTRDDSWENDTPEQVKAAMAPAERRRYAHAITRCLGALPPGRAEPLAHLGRRSLDDAGTVLLCSDGVYGYAGEPEDLAGVLDMLGREEVDALTLARNVALWAAYMGGKDNASAVVAVVDRPEPAPAAVPSLAEPA